MNWKLKAAVFRALDRVPFGENLHYLMQLYLTRSWPRPQQDLTALREFAQEMLQKFSTYSDIPISKARFLEIGAGRDLAVPIALKLLGVGQVIAVDVQRLAKLDLVNHAALVLANQLRTDVVPFSSWAALQQFGIEYRAPCHIESQSSFMPVDAFISRSVLEHVPPHQLERMLLASKTFLAKGGLSVHGIDYGDHYARDGAVSKHNFLSFEDEEWNKFNSSFQYVNRLRHSEVVAMHESAGLEIVELETATEDVPPQILGSLAGRFRALKPDDLSIVYSRIVSRRT